MAVASDVYRIEHEAEERGAREMMLRNLAGDVGMLRRDVQRLTWVAVPVSLVALTAALVALVISLILAYLLAPSHASAAALLLLPPAGFPRRLRPSVGAAGLSGFLAEALAITVGLVAALMLLISVLVRVF